MKDYKHRPIISKAPSSLCAKVVLLSALYRFGTEHQVLAAGAQSEMAAQSGAVMAAQVESGVMADVEMEAEVDAEADSSIQSLSESFLQAEALAEVKMVAEQEHELKQKESIEELEKDKFIEIVSDNDRELLSQAIAAPEERKEEQRFVANVFDNYDAATGLRIENESLETPSQAAVDKLKEDTANTSGPTQSLALEPSPGQKPSESASQPDKAAKEVEKTDKSDDKQQQVEPSQQLEQNGGAQSKDAEITMKADDFDEALKEAFDEDQQKKNDADQNRAEKDEAKSKRDDSKSDKEEGSSSSEAEKSTQEQVKAEDDKSDNKDNSKDQEKSEQNSNDKQVQPLDKEKPMKIESEKSSGSAPKTEKAFDKNDSADDKKESKSETQEKTESTEKVKNEDKNTERIKKKAEKDKQMKKSMRKADEAAKRARQAIASASELNAKVEADIRKNIDKQQTIIEQKKTEAVLPKVSKDAKPASSSPLYSVVDKSSDIKQSQPTQASLQQPLESKIELIKPQNPLPKLQAEGLNKTVESQQLKVEQQKKPEAKAVELKKEQNKTIEQAKPELKIKEEKKPDTKITEQKKVEVQVKEPAKVESTKTETKPKEEMKTAVKKVEGKKPEDRKEAKSIGNQKSANETKPIAVSSDQQKPKDKLQDPLAEIKAGQDGKPAPNVWRKTLSEQRVEQNLKEVSLKKEDHDVLPKQEIIQQNKTEDKKDKEVKKEIKKEQKKEKAPPAPVSPSIAPQPAVLSKPHQSIEIVVGQSDSPHKQIDKLQSKPAELNTMDSSAQISQSKGGEAGTQPAVKAVSSKEGSQNVHIEVMAGGQPISIDIQPENKKPEASAPKAPLPSPTPPVSQQVSQSKVSSEEAAKAARMKEIQDSLKMIHQQMDDIEKKDQEQDKKDLEKSEGDDDGKDDGTPEESHAQLSSIDKDKELIIKKEPNTKNPTAPITNNVKQQEENKDDKFKRFMKKSKERQMTIRNLKYENNGVPDDHAFQNKANQVQGASQNWNGTSIAGQTDLTIFQEFNQIRAQSNFTDEPAEVKQSKVQTDSKLQINKEGEGSKLEEHTNHESRQLSVVAATVDFFTRPIKFVYKKINSLFQSDWL